MLPFRLQVLQVTEGCHITVFFPMDMKTGFGLNAEALHPAVSGGE
jgi:hypothetical protein